MAAKARYLWLGAVALTAVGCGQGTVTTTTGDVTTTLAPATTEAPDTTRAPDTTEPDTGAAPALTEPGPLPAGTYTTDQFTPQLTFTVGDGWAVEIPDMSEIFGLGTTEEGFDEENFPLLSFVRYTTVFDYSGATREEIPAPDDMAEFLTGLPGVEAGAVTDTTLAGFPARTFDLEVVEAPGEEEGEPRLEVGMVLGRPFWFQVGTQVRFWVVEVGDATVTISAESHPDDFDRFMPMAEEVVETLEFVDAES